MSIRTKLSALLVLCVLTPLLFSAVFWTRQLDPRDDRGRTSFAGREERRQSVSVPPEAPSRYLFFLKDRDEMLNVISERMSRSMERRNAAVAKALARAGRDLDVGLRVYDLGPRPLKNRTEFVQVFELVNVLDQVG
jgi:hypothetical protein